VTFVYPTATAFVSEKTTSSNDPGLLLLHALQPEGHATECGLPPAYPRHEAPTIYSNVCPYCVLLLAVRVNESLA
jgi:hypothetical protein